MTPQIVDEFRKQYSILKNSSADNASGRLVAIMDWLCKESLAKRVIDKLIDSVDEAKVFPPNARRAKIVAHTREETAFAGYALMANCRNHRFWELCTQHNIRGPYNSSNIHEITNAGLREYVVPFLDYVELELLAATSDATVTSMLDSRVSVAVEERIASDLPAVSEMLRQIAAEFVRPSDEVNWQNIGNSCRESLKATVRVLLDQTSTELPEDVQLGNVKRVAELLTAASGEGDSRGTLLKLIGAVWDHANTVTHREATTRSDAARLFVWTSLAIFELLDMTLKGEHAGEFKEP